MSAGWLYLLAAGVAEVAFALCLKQAAGFTRLWPSLGLVIAGL
ncbi:MAG: SMR family transporter, partial [Pseudomonadota bacterium]